MKITDGDVRDLLRKAEVLVDVEKLKADVPLTKQGIDSLDMAGIFLLLEEKVGAEVSDEDIKTMKSIADMIAFAEGKSG